MQIVKELEQTDLAETGRELHRFASFPLTIKRGLFREFCPAKNVIWSIPQKAA
jgi:hypothetical protein